MKRIALFLILSVAIAGGMVLAQDPPALRAEPPEATETLASASLDKLTIHPGTPFKNLTLFMITGPEPLKDRKLLTLDEALEAKTIKIKETGNVNQLEAINSGQDDVYIPSGTIFRGGKQDRMCPQDYIIGSGKTVPLQSFCVERGRWTKRGNAPVTHFQQSENIVSSRELKLASRSQGDQGQVWSQVEGKQKKLSDNLQQDVRSGESNTSLELALDNKKLQEEIDLYIKERKDLPSRQEDTIGYAFAVNSKVYGIDTYGSSELFVKLWPKLLRSAAIEAISDRTDAETQPAKAEKVREFLEQSAKGKRKQTAQGGQAFNGQYEAVRSLGWTSRDEGKMLRVNIINTEDLEELRQAPVRNQGNQFQGNRMQQNLPADIQSNQQIQVVPPEPRQEEDRQEE